VQQQGVVKGRTHNFDATGTEVIMASDRPVTVVPTGRKR
jgi:hypothetical protein